MDKTIRKYTDFDEMKADEYRYWQTRPIHEMFSKSAAPRFTGPFGRTRNNGFYAAADHL
jgi:hypothetical protein